MCPLWFRALSSKCGCGRDGIKHLLSHDEICPYRINWLILLEAEPDLEDHWLYAEMYKEMMYE